MELRLPDMNGIDAIVAIRTEFPEARIIVLTTFEGDVDAQRALEAGARGYVLKTMPSKELVVAIRQVHAGKKLIPTEVAAQLAEHLGEEDLTPREMEVLKLVGCGNRPAHRRTALHLGGDSQGSHKHIMEKLGARDRAQAVAIALLRGIIQLEPAQPAEPKK